MHSIYKLNFPNGKSYIGQTKKDPLVRFGASHKDSIYKAVKGKRKSYKRFHFKEI